MNVLTDKVKNILTAAVDTHSIGEIANKLGLTVAAVAGSLATIKKDNLATYEDKKLVLTTEGLAAIGVTAKKVKNKHIVADIVAANVGKTNAELVDLICAALNKGKVDARVYLYNYEKAAGLRTVGQKQAA